MFDSASQVDPEKVESVPRAVFDTRDACGRWKGGDQRADITYPRVVSTVRVESAKQNRVPGMTRVDGKVVTVFPGR